MDEKDKYYVIEASINENSRMPIMRKMSNDTSSVLVWKDKKQVEQSDIFKEIKNRVKENQIEIVEVKRDYFENLRKKFKGMIIKIEIF